METINLHFLHLYNYVTNFYSIIQVFYYLIVPIFVVGDESGIQPPSPPSFS